MAYRQKLSCLIFSLLLSFHSLIAMYDSLDFDPAESIVNLNVGVKDLHYNSDGSNLVIIGTYKNKPALQLAQLSYQQKKITFTLKKINHREIENLFFLNDTQLCIKNNDTDISIYDIHEDKVIYNVKMPSTIQKVVGFQDTLFILLHHNNQIFLKKWNVSTKEEKEIRLRSNEIPKDIILSSDGKHLVINCGKSFIIFNTDNENEQRFTLSEPCNDIILSPDNTMLLFVFDFDDISLWHIQEKKTLHECNINLILKNRKSYCSLKNVPTYQFSPDSKKIFVRTIYYPDFLLKYVSQNLISLDITDGTHTAITFDNTSTDFFIKWHPKDPYIIKVIPNTSYIKIQTIPSKNELERENIRNILWKNMLEATQRGEEKYNAELKKGDIDKVQSKRVITNYSVQKTFLKDFILNSKKLFNYNPIPLLIQTLLKINKSVHCMETREEVVLLD